MHTCRGRLVVDIMFYLKPVRLREFAIVNAGSSDVYRIVLISIVRLNCVKGVVVAVTQTAVHVDVSHC